MALIQTVALTTLENIKLVLGVSGTTTHDALLELLIGRTSRRVTKYLGRKLHYEEYLEDASATGRQLLLLDERPIIEVVSVTDRGTPLVLDTDFRCDKQDAYRGALYKEDGWKSVSLVSGLTSDIQASARLTKIDYKAGYLFPLESGYEDGKEPDFVAKTPGSLPLEIQGVVDEMVAESFVRTQNGSFGIIQLREGGESISYKDSQASTEMGISDEHSSVLNGYRREVVA